MAVVMGSCTCSALAAHSMSAWACPASAQSPTLSLPSMPQSATAAP